MTARNVYQSLKFFSSVLDLHVRMGEYLVGYANHKFYLKISTHIFHLSFRLQFVYE